MREVSTNLRMREVGLYTKKSFQDALWKCDPEILLPSEVLNRSECPVQAMSHDEPSRVAEIAGFE